MGVSVLLGKREIWGLPGKTWNCILQPNCQSYVAIRLIQKRRNG